jgi:hypothetical protein
VEQRKIARDERHKAKGYAPEDRSRSRNRQTNSTLQELGRSRNLAGITPIEGGKDMAAKVAPASQQPPKHPPPATKQLATLPPKQPPNVMMPPPSHPPTFHLPGGSGLGAVPRSAFRSENEKPNPHPQGSDEWIGLEKWRNKRARHKENKRRRKEVENDGEKWLVEPVEPELNASQESTSTLNSSTHDWPRCGSELAKAKKAKEARNAAEEDAASNREGNLSWTEEAMDLELLGSTPEDLTRLDSAPGDSTGTALSPGARETVALLKEKRDSLKELLKGKLGGTTGAHVTKELQKVNLAIAKAIEENLLGNSETETEENLL